MVEEESGRRFHDTRVISDGDRGERRGDGQGESDNASEGWGGGSEGDLAEETEEDGMTMGEPEGSRDMLTASPWGMEEIGAGVIKVGARSGGSNTSKVPSADANKVGTQGRNGERPGQ